MKKFCQKKMFYSEEALGLPHVLKEDIQVICGFKRAGALG